MSSFIIDDPMLAAIARFAGCCTRLEVSDETFLREQLAQVRSYVAGYPEEQRQERALEWIAGNAEEYRRKWRRQMVAGEASASRCPDCPLEPRAGQATCEIHDRWLQILTGYVAGAASSRDYVEESLSLLAGHKQRLRESIPRMVHA